MLNRIPTTFMSNAARSVSQLACDCATQFYKSRFIPVSHAIVSCVLVSFGKDVIAIYFSGAYFILDLLACIYKRDIAFTFHAVLSILMISLCAMGMFVDQRPVRLLFAEVSTPLLYAWKENKQKNTFGAFIAVFFVCRILLIPYVLLDLLGAGRYLMLPVLWYILNLLWFYKLWNLYHDYKGPSGNLSLCLLGLVPFGYSMIFDRSYIAGLVVVNGIAYHGDPLNRWKKIDTFVCCALTYWVTIVSPCSRPFAVTAAIVWYLNNKDSDLVHVIGVQFMLWLGLQFYIGNITSPFI